MFSKRHLNCTEHWLVQEENHFLCKIFIWFHFLGINTNLSPYGKSIKEIIDTWFHFGFHSFHISIYSCCISLNLFFWWFFVKQIDFDVVMTAFKKTCIMIQFLRCTFKLTYVSRKENSFYESNVTSDCRYY